MKTLLNAVLIAIVAGASFGCGGSAEQATPQATFETFQGSIADENWDRALACMTPGSQDTFVGGLTMMARLTAFGDEEKGKQLTEMLTKHGVDTETPQPTPGTNPQQMMKQQVAGADKPALLNDLMTWFEENAPEKAESRTPTEGFENAELGEVTVSETTARGEFTQQGGKTNPIVFKKIDGQWYIDYEAAMQEQMQQRQNPPVPAAPRQVPPNPSSSPQ